jgi:hypothetical protein
MRMLAMPPRTGPDGCRAVTADTINIKKKDIRRM